MTAQARARREARQLFKDCFVGARLDENRVRRVAVAIIETGRRRGPAVLSRFSRLVRLNRDSHTARIVSAEPSLCGFLRASLMGSLRGWSFWNSPLYQSS